MRAASRLLFGLVPGALGVLAGVLVALVIGFLTLGAVVGATIGQDARAQASCVRWYVDGCVPAGEGNLDCDDLRVTPLTVKGADPFDFDQDLDGEGCESG